MGDIFGDLSQGDFGGALGQVADPFSGSAQTQLEQDLDSNNFGQAALDYGSQIPGQSAVTGTFGALELPGYLIGEVQQAVGGGTGVSSWLNAFNNSLLSNPLAVGTTDAAVLSGNYGAIGGEFANAAIAASTPLSQFGVTGVAGSIPLVVPFAAIVVGIVVLIVSLL